jgi:hypothetical protein
MDHQDFDHQDRDHQDFVIPSRLQPVTPARASEESAFLDLRYVTHYDPLKIAIKEALNMPMKNPPHPGGSYCASALNCWA